MYNEKGNSDHVGGWGSKRGKNSAIDPLKKKTQWGKKKQFTLAHLNKYGGASFTKDIERKEKRTEGDLRQRGGGGGIGGKTFPNQKTGSSHERESGRKQPRSGIRGVASSYCPFWGIMGTAETGDGRGENTWRRGKDLWGGRITAP